MAQPGTPAYLNNNTGVTSNAFPFNTTANIKIQWIYTPGAFTTLGGGSGTAAPGGFAISKIYIKFSSTVNASTVYPNLTISLGQNLGTQANWGTVTNTTYPFTTGLTTCFFQASGFQFTGITAGAWYGITLQTPFPYDPSQSLIVEAKSTLTSSGGNGVANVTTSGQCQRLYGGNLATTGTSNTGLTPVGFDLISTAVCTAPPTPGTATATPSSGICVGTNISLNLTGNSVGSGQSYQWQTSSSIGGTYVNFGAPQTSPPLSTPATSTLYYRCEVTCSGNSQVSAPVLVSVNPPFPGGNYTINSAVATGGTNFQTFNDLVSALSCGIAGAVNVNVVAASGPYTEQVEFPQIGGTSSVNTITINGNGNTLTFAGSAALPHTLSLNGADYITINNLNVIGTDATNALTCHLWNGADNNTFNGCVFTASLSATGTIQSPFSLSGTAATATGTGNSGSNNTISNCTMNGGYYGFVFSGSVSNTGNQILNSTVSEFYTYGIYHAYCQSSIIKGNMVERPTRTNPSSGYGVYLTTSTANCIVDGNTIRNLFGGLTTSSGTAYCLYNSVSATLGNENIWINNLVYNINNGAGTIYGIYIPTFNYVKMYHNTIVIDDAAATAGTVYAIYCNGTGVDIKNNISYVTRGGSGTKYCIYNSGTAATSDNNVFYMNAPAGTNYIGYQSSAYATLALYQAGTGKDLNSVQQNPLFNSYIPSNGLVNNIGAPLGVGFDIAGNSRSVTTPDPGAYEFSLGGLDASIGWVSPTSPAAGGLQTITVNIANTQAQTITALNLSYFNGTSTVTESFSGLNIISGTNQNISFTTQYNLVSSVTITANILSVNGGSDIISANNTVSYYLCFALNGTYTINAAATTGGSNFQSFTDAVAAMSCGITGPVVFNVVAASGPYNQQVTIPFISGGSAVNTITFNGNGNTLTFAGTAGNPNTFALNGADYITVNNLTIIASDPTYAIAGHLYGGADNNNFNNCTFQSSTTGTTTILSAFCLNGSATAASASGNSGNNNTITGCTMIGGYYNTIMYGATASPFNTGNSVINCNIRDFYSYGLYNLYCQGTTFRGNVVERTTRTNTGTTYCIYLSTSSYNCLVEKNRVRRIFDGQQTSTSTAYAMYNGASGGVGFENKWINNLVSDMRSAGILYGFYSAGYTNVKCYHNTISFDHTAATAGTVYGIYAYGTATDIKNNNVSITRGGTGTKYCMYMSATNTASSNYNNLYINSSGGSNYVGYYSTAFVDLAAWQTANGGTWDQQSVSANPLFFNPAIGNYKPTEVLIDNIGYPLGVTDDITNALRSPSAPDPGAYEFAVLPKDIGVFAFAGPNAGGCYTNAETIIVTLRNYGTQVLNFSVDPVTVTCNITGPITTTVSALLNSGTLAVGATMNVSLSPTVNGTANGTYTFDAYTTMASDGEPLNDAYPSFDITVGAIAGTVSSTQNSICASGNPVLTVSGVYGGDIQWQKSTVSAAGPWTNVGTNNATYTPGAVTQTTWYRALTVCNSNSVPSNIVNVIVNNPALLSTAPAARCGLGTVTLGATVNSGYVVNWYDSPSSYTILATGNTFTTPVISSTTTYYAAASDGGSIASMGLANRVGATTNSGYADIGLVFDALQAFTLQSVAIYPVATTPSGNVTATIALKNSAGTILQSTTISVPTSVSPGVKTLIPLNFVVPAGSQHRLVFTSASGGGITGFIREATTGYTYPYTLPGTASITSAYTSGVSADYYYYFYDWTVSTGCEGTRTAVAATVTAPPALSIIPADAAICPLSSTTISVSSINDPNYNYTWTSNPVGFSATGTGPHTISPTVSTYYVVTATDNTAGPNAGCVARDSVQVVTGSTLSAGTVNASQTTLCVSGTPTLTVTGADGGAIQWQSSTVSASGPWTNVGTGTSVYAPGTVNQTTYYQVRVSCQSTSIYSNVATVSVNIPVVSSTTPDSRCGIGTVNLQATAAGGATLNWYNSPAGGAAIGTGTTFTTPVIPTTTNYYVAANSGGGGSGGTAIAITEFDLGTNDVLEIQNVSPGAVDVTGWRVAVGNNYSTFNSVNANVQVLSGTVAPGGVLTWTDATGGPNYWGSNILWNPGAFPTFTGWAIIIDNTGNIVDFVALNWPAATIAANTLTVGPFTVSPSTKWTGDGINQTTVSAAQGVSRQGTSDNNTLSDFSIINLSLGTVNPGMTIPFSGFGCESTRTQVTATVTPSPNISASSSMPMVCSGQSATLTASSSNPDYTYTWQPGNLSGPSVTVAPAVNTVYTLNAVDNTAGPFSQCAAIATLTVNGSAALPPFPNASSNAPVCENADVILAAYDGSNYAWTGPGGYSYTGSSGTANVSSAQLSNTGNYSVLVTNTYGCTNSETIYVQVNDNPEPFEASMTPVGCGGDNTGSFQVGVNGGTPFFSFFESITQVQNFTGSYTGLVDGTYYVDVNDLNQCVSQTPLVVTVTTVPNAPPVIVCPANITTANTPGTCGAIVNYATPVGSDVCPVTGTVQTNGLPTGSSFPIGTLVNTFVVTDVFNATATCSFTVTVTDSELPAITNCPASFSACNPISWIPPTITDNCLGLQVISSHTPGSNFGPGNTLVTYTATDAYNNVSTCSFTVTRLEESVKADNITSNREFNNICSGDNITLTVNGGSVGAGSSWKWYTGSCGGTALPAFNGMSSITVAPAVTTTYFVRAEGQCNTTLCESITVVVSTTAPNSVVITSAPAIAAPGVTGVVTCTAVPGATFYRWTSILGHINAIWFNGQPGPVETSTNSVNVSFQLALQNYQIRVVAGNACGRSNNASAHIRGTVPAPTCLTGPVLACPNTSATYSVASCPIQGTNSYQWSVTPASAITSSSGQGTATFNVTFAPGFSGAQICVNGVSNFGLAGPTTCLNVSTNTAAPGAISGNNAPCQSGTEIYSVVLDPAATSYVWSTNIVGATASGTTNNGTVQFPAGPFSGQVCVQAVSGCGMSVATCYNVTSGVAGIPGPISGPVSGICGASNVNYSLATNNANTYNWILPAGVTIVGSANANSVNVNFAPGLIGNQTITVNAIYNCGSASSSIVVNGAPAVPTITPATICMGQDELYFASSAGADNYTFTTTGADFEECTNGAIPCSQYYVVWSITGGTLSVTASNTCGTSAPFSMGTNCRISNGNMDTKVYPNPTDGKLTVEFTSYTGGQYNLTITDMAGRTVKNEDVKATSGLNQHFINLETANPGMYVLYLKDAQGDISVHKVTVE